MAEVKGLWINGSWHVRERRQPIVSLATGEVLAEISLASSEDVAKAVEGAHTAFLDWRKRSAHERSRILYRLVELIKEHHASLSRLIAEEAGKPLKAARGEVSRAIQTYLFSAEEAKRIGGETIPMDAAPGGEGRLGFTWREPLGVVAAITPFNFPLNLVAHKLGPAIASGNAVVLKPAGATPLSSLRIAELFAEAGLPEGVLQVVTGSGGEIGDLLVTHPLIKLITFTGSPVVGKRIREKSGLKRTILELGSNSAVVVEPDAPFQLAVRRVAEGAFQYAGQICISVQRIYVHEDIFDRFREALQEATMQLKVGSPLEDTTDVGPMIHAKEAERVASWIEAAVQGGAKIAYGGTREGQYLAPTILLDVKPDMSVVKDEVFGPVASLIPYSHLDEAIKMVNDSRYGLNVGLFTRDIAKAFRAARMFEVGGVMVNEIPTFRVDHMPYGGVKESGLGREGIQYAIEEMTELKFVMVNLNI